MLKHEGIVSICEMSAKNKTVIHVQSGDYGGMLSVHISIKTPIVPIDSNKAEIWQRKTGG